MFRSAVFLFVTIEIFVGVLCVPVKFSARNLPLMDAGPIKGAPDAYIKIYYAPDIDTPLSLLGVTENISDNQNPDWIEVFEVPSVGKVGERLHVVMFDSDSPTPDAYMGFAEAVHTELLQDDDGILPKILIGGTTEQGILVIKRQEQK